MLAVFGFFGGLRLLQAHTTHTVLGGVGRGYLAVFENLASFELGRPPMKGARVRREHRQEVYAWNAKSAKDAKLEMLDTKGNMEMPVRVVFHGGNFYPAIFCDFCNRRIEDARDGNYEFPLPGPYGSGDEELPVYFTHKGCSHAFEQTSGLLLGSEDLMMLPLFLERNLALTRKEIMKRMKAFSWCFASNNLPRGRK